MRHRMFRSAGVAAATHFVRRRRGLMLGALGASASNFQVAAFLPIPSRQGAQTEGTATRRLIHSTPHRGAGWSRSIARFRKVPSASSTGHTDPDRAVNSDATDGGNGKDNNSPRGALDHDHVISIAESTGGWLLGKIEFARRQSLFYGGTSAIGVRVSLRRTVPPLLEDIFQLDDRGGLGGGVGRSDCSGWESVVWCGNWVTVGGIGLVARTRRKSVGRNN